MDLYSKYDLIRVNIVENLMVSLDCSLTPVTVVHGKSLSWHSKLEWTVLPSQLVNVQLYYYHISQDAALQPIKFKLRHRPNISASSVLSALIKRFQVLFRPTQTHVPEVRVWLPALVENKIMYLCSYKEIWWRASTKWRMWGYLSASFQAADKLWPSGSLICPSLHFSSILSEAPFTQPAFIYLLRPRSKF